jgi:hypothetical protein
MRMEAAILAINSVPDYLELRPGDTASLTFTIQRALGFSTPVHIELILPEGALGVTAEPANITAEETKAFMSLRLAPDATLGSHEAIRFRATGARDDLPVIAETSVELHLVPAR